MMNPKVGEIWKVKIPSMIRERGNETFNAEIIEETEDGLWRIRPVNQASAWPIRFGRVWFKEKV